MLITAMATVMLMFVFNESQKKFLDDSMELDIAVYCDRAVKEISNIVNDITVEVNQTPEDAARTELYEETGYIPNRLELLCKLDPDTGRLTNKIWCYIAKDLKKDELWEGENGITVEEHSINKLNQLVISGEIINAYNLAELFMARLRSSNLNNI